MTRLGLGAPEAGAALERALELALGLEPGPDVFAAIYRRYLWLLMAGDFAAVQRLADVVLAHAATAQGPEAADRFTLLGRLARGSVLWCLGDAEPAVQELERALQLAQGAGVGVLVMAFGDPAVRIRMFLCHALAEAGRRDEAIAVADEMVHQAHLSGPADESDALATRGMMYAAFEEPRQGPRRRRRGREAGATRGGQPARALRRAQRELGRCDRRRHPRIRCSGARPVSSGGIPRDGHPDARPDRLHDAGRGRGRPPVTRTGRRRPRQPDWTPSHAPAAGCGVGGSSGPPTPLRSRPPEIAPPARSSQVRSRRQARAADRRQEQQQGCVARRWHHERDDQRHQEHRIDEGGEPVEAVVTLGFGHGRIALMTVPPVRLKRPTGGALRRRGSRAVAAGRRSVGRR